MDSLKCECGGRYTRSHKAHHIKTQKHKNYKPPDRVKLIREQIKILSTEEKTNLTLLLIGDHYKDFDLGVKNLVLL